MKIALAQINPTVGDIAGNSSKIKHCIREAEKQGAELVVFSELAVVGYPPKDLLLRDDFVSDNITALEELGRSCGDCAALVGYVARHEGETGKELHNGAALLHKGRIEARYYKQLLPTYDVFDESRYFQPVASQPVVAFKGKRFGLSICEDIWQTMEGQAKYPYEIRPLAEVARAQVDVVLNMSASPFVMGKHKFRGKIFSEQCRHYHLPLIYVNQVGGNDELIFDGCSCAFDREGKLIGQAKGFAEDLLIVDLENPEGTRKEEIPTETASVHKGLVLGLRDYVNKCGFGSMVLGLSGGIDSAVTAALAVEALGKDKVTGVALPSRYSSEGSMTDAKELAENLGIKLLIIPIEKGHIAFEEMLKEAFAGREPDLAEENIQARIRGTILMGLSNKFGHLVLATGNKSELAVGYCTLYGDMAGGLAVIGDVPKKMVYELARYMNRKQRVIPESSISKAPSAELRPDQKDQDSLPPYDELDEILQRYIEQEQSPSEIMAAGFAEQTVARVIRLVDRNEYKRKQAAPALKVTSRAFGTGRRMPIAQNYRPSGK